MSAVPASLLGRLEQAPYGAYAIDLNQKSCSGTCRPSISSDMRHRRYLDESAMKSRRVSLRTA